jgi:hypothetical protein
VTGFVCGFLVCAGALFLGFAGALCWILHDLPEQGFVLGFVRLCRGFVRGGFYLVVVLQGAAFFVECRL